MQIKLIFVVTLFFGAASFANLNKIDPILTKTLNTNNSANIVISFVGGNTKIVDAIETQTFGTRTQRLQSLTTALKDHAKISQKNVISFLNSNSIEHRSFWISNQIYISNADKQLVKEIETFSEVDIIEEEKVINLDIPKFTKTDLDSNLEVQWNLEKIKVPEAWAISNGSGVVLGTIASGVRYTHEALRDNYRFINSWRDPYYNSPRPDDPTGHGTHTMGSAVGTTAGIGVAPGVQWMACRGCSNSGACNQLRLADCAEWMLCPDPDCAQAPNVISNSWGGGGRGNKWFEPMTEAWIAGGIVPVFSVGNEGPRCSSVNSPGDLRRVIGVGSTNILDEISGFSAVGPAVDGRIKPEITAPGEEILSSYIDDDASYFIASGTSMAAPHVAGVTALLLSVNPNLTFAQVRSILIGSVDTDELVTEGRICESVSDTTFPNHHFGYGRINALKVVQAGKAKIQK